jgi:hypothetical protein
MAWIRYGLIEVSWLREIFTPASIFSRTRPPRDSHHILAKIPQATAMPGISRKSLDSLAVETTQPPWLVSGICHAAILTVAETGALTRLLGPNFKSKRSENDWAESKEGSVRYEVSKHPRG